MFKGLNGEIFYQFTEFLNLFLTKNTFTDVCDVELECETIINY